MKRLSIIALTGCGITIGAEFPPPEPDPEPEPWGVPITGGTLLVTRDGTRAVVADPDRDRVVIVDLAREVLIDAVDLAAGSEPGRVIEDGSGRIHVALRGSGELWTLAGGEQQLRAVCAEPRGLAWDETGDLVHVACATGELVSIGAAGGAPVRVVRVERDLRDVIVRDTGLVVTTLRTAEVLVLDAQGLVTSRVQSPVTHRIEQPHGGGGILLAVGDILDAKPAVAWRTIALPDGRLLMSHQRRVALTLKLEPGGYDGQCEGGPVESALTLIGTNDTPTPLAPLLRGSLPVDLALDPTSGAVVVVTAGNRAVHRLAPDVLATFDDDECENDDLTLVHDFDFGWATSQDLGTPTSVAFRPNGALIVFYPEPAALVIRDQDGGTRAVPLGGTPGGARGRALFHQQTSVGIACASCHPEARDDGGVWMFEGLGPRRTQSLAGGILFRAPYHWGADMPDLDALLANVFSMRMSGGIVEPDDGRALGAWLDRVPAPSGTVLDAAAIERGQTLFMSSEVGCASCHVGALYTNNQLANVGTGIMVKVPSLVGVGARAPYMHDGCAATLRDRFGTCGGGDFHGRTSQLSSAQLDDLIGYLEAL